MRVAYLGPPGTFTQEALSRCVPDDAERKPHLLMAEVYEAVLGGDADVGVLPIENSLEGSVGTTLDLLVHRPGLRICGETVLPIRHNLLALPGTELSGVVGVMSHQQALGQCARTLRDLLPHVPQEASASTAEAAQRAAQRPGWAAIGSLAAAGHNGLSVLAAGIQDGDDNTTRFVLLGKTYAPPSGQDRTSIAFLLLRDQPGGLYEVLGEFAWRGINLLKIESRPKKRALGQYIFFLDFIGHSDDPMCADALAATHKRVHGLYLLGSYRRG